MLRLNKLDTSSDSEIAFLKKIYTESFPTSERRSFNYMLELYNNESNIFTILMVFKNEIPIGFFTYWSFNEYIFAEHFAIITEIRNGGVGKKVMELFLKAQTKPIILEVELPSTILSERRIGFYQRLGFKLWNDIPYQQPPYRENENPIPMKLMTKGEIDLNKNIKTIKEDIYSIVYGW